VFAVCVCFGDARGMWVKLLAGRESGKVAVGGVDIVKERRLGRSSTMLYSLRDMRIIGQTFFLRRYFVVCDRA
jgi:hypothetical protein